MAAEYFPLHCHTDGSLLDGLSKPWQVAARVRQLGLGGCAMTDHGCLTSCVDFLKAMAEACKNCGHPKNRHADGGKGKCNLRDCPGCPGYEKAPLKPILGLEFYLCAQDAARREPDNRPLSHLCVLAKDIDGWRQLVKASSESNRPEFYYYKPRLDLDRLGSFAQGKMVAFSGHMGSDLANVCFGDPKSAYRAATYEEARAAAKPWPDLKKDVLALAGKYRELFGKDNFFLEIQLIDQQNLPAATIVAKTLRWVAKQTGIPTVATADSHYPAKEDAVDQRVLLCAATDMTMAQAQRKLKMGEDVQLGGFFRSNQYHIPSVEDMVKLHTPEELAGTMRVAEMCSLYSISSPPRMPKFDCPDGVPQEGFVRDLIEKGWTRKVAGKVDEAQHATYRQRIETEMGVLTKNELVPYFLIVWDICRYAQEELGCKAAKGRGSAAGSLVAHLLNITNCDPLKYDLLFERFYNDGRNAPGRVSMPDIDMDFPIAKREPIKAYVRKKYGEEHVCEMATFGRMQGRGALTDVLRAWEWGTHEQRKEITANIPDESEIADLLQEMREETGEASIIQWALENNGDALKEWCVLNEDGTLDGELRQYFAQAIRLEGTKRSQSKHAAGIIISTEPLADIVPMSYDKGTGRMNAALDMKALEDMGALKMDCLGVAAYDKCRGAFNSARTGKVVVE
jgi:DNA polymerase-3 subunit alpha